MWWPEPAMSPAEWWGPGPATPSPAPSPAPSPDAPFLGWWDFGTGAQPETPPAAWPDLDELTSPPASPSAASWLDEALTAAPEPVLEPVPAAPITRPHGALVVETHRRREREECDLDDVLDVFTNSARFTTAKEAARITGLVCDTNVALGRLILCRPSGPEFTCAAVRIKRHALIALVGGRHGLDAVEVGCISADLIARRGVNVIVSMEHFLEAACKHLAHTPV